MILLADNDLKRMGETAAKLLSGDSEVKFPENLDDLLQRGETAMKLLEKSEIKFPKNLEKISTICAIEYGHVIRNVNGDGIEHFGYVDGVSQPLFLKDEGDDYAKFHNTTYNATQQLTDSDGSSDNKKQSVGNKLKFDPRANTDLVLIKDPYWPNDNFSFGSYFVFRKLEQDVKKFKEREEDIGKELFPKPADKHKREIVGAYLVGRAEDGTPVVITETEGLIGSGNFNNFDYKDDPSGGRCPHFAHIRKTNPRDDKPDSDGTPVEHKRRIMARRGIPYGHRAIDTALGFDPSPDQMPENGVGLLFMSYQRSIVDQFEAIQKNWANDVKFPEDATGIDPIIGQFKGDDSNGNPVGTEYKDPGRFYQFPKVYGNNSPSTSAQPTKTSENYFDQFVHMKGGEYFFAPSMSFLRNIDTIQSDVLSEINLQSEAVN